MTNAELIHEVRVDLDSTIRKPCDCEGVGTVEEVMACPRHGQGERRATWLADLCERLEQTEEARDLWAHQCNLTSEAQANGLNDAAAWKARAEAAEHLLRTMLDYKDRRDAGASKDERWVRGWLERTRAALAQPGES